MDSTNRFLWLGLPRKMTSESRNSSNLSKKVFFFNFSKKMKFFKSPQLFFGGFRHKRFFDLDTERAEFSENEGFVGLLYVALCESIPFL